jgi:tetratricopeptide (TPR) repeat protein
LFRFYATDIVHEDERRMEKKHKSRSEGEGSKDYLAIYIFIAALAAFFVAGYFSLKVITKDRTLSQSIASPEWLRNIERYVDELLSKLPGGKVLRTEKTLGAIGYLRLGHRYYRNKKFREALNAYEKAVESDPENAEARYWRGRTLLNRGQFDPAAEDFKTAVRLKPDYSEAYDNLGWLSARRGDFAEGIDYLTKSLELRPENAWAHYNRGHMFLRKGDLGNALKDFEEACKLGFQEGCTAYEAYRDRRGVKEEGWGEEGGQVSGFRDDAEGSLDNKRIQSR